VKCTIHPRHEATTTCSGCMKPLCADAVDAAGYCTVCVARMAADDIRTEDRERAAGREARDARDKRIARLKTAAMVALLCACVAAALWQAPAAVHSLEDQKPLRIGTYATDAQADACIANLWIVSRRLQGGKPPVADLTCPASRLAYAPQQEKDGLVVRCPRPGRHGLASLSVSRAKPVPEVRQ